MNYGGYNALHPSDPAVYRDMEQFVEGGTRSDFERIRGRFSVARAPRQKFLKNHYWVFELCHDGVMRRSAALPAMPYTTACGVACALYELDTRLGIVRAAKPAPSTL